MGKEISSAADYWLNADYTMTWAFRIGAAWGCLTRPRESFATISQLGYDYAKIESFKSN